MMGGPVSGCSIVKASALVRLCLGFFSFRDHIPFFQISYYSLAIILVSAFFSSFTLAVPMREVSCVGYEPRAWDPCSLQPILDGDTA